MNPDRPNWIKKQAECQLSLVFTRLCKEVETDVREMEKYAPELKRDCSFEIDQHSDRLTVQCQSDWPHLAFTVHFNVREEKDCIEIKVQAPGNRNRTHELCPEWNPKRDQCTLFFNGDPLKYWEVCKRIFKPLFFSEKEGRDHADEERSDV